MSDVTQWLQEVSKGDSQAEERLLDAIYGELRKLAQSHLQRERPDHTLQATALVHEAYMKLVDQKHVQWQNRAHFFAMASQAIRRILVDHARSLQRAKRGGNRQKLQLDEAQALGATSPDLDLLELDGALAALGEEHPDKVKVVEMRFFAGLTNDEIAEVLEVTTRTVERYWQFARAWLFRRISSGSTTPPP
jgi:RNA polymerase sigma factor (TIGR02999 family)